MTDVDGSFRWMTTKGRYRLHALTGDGWGRSVEALVAGESTLGGLERFACGMRLPAVYPGVADRHGLARCRRCCRRTRTGDGWGWPDLGN